MLSSFPEARRPAIARALAAAFGTAVLDGATPLTGGLSGAGVYRIRVGGIAYVLRIDGPANAFVDPARAHACMGIAADACLAPRVRYASSADGVAITDFIPTHSLAQDYPGDGKPLIVELAQAVRVLHQTPAFPSLVDYLAGMQGLIATNRACGILDAGTLAPVLARYDVLRAGYQTAARDLVSSHNDLNPGNLAYDGRRIWLLDWDAAFLADRYVDIATIANWFANDPEREDLLLTTYFNAPVDAEQRARLYLMRQVNHMFYGMTFLNGAAVERPAARLSGLACPTLAEIGRRLSAGDFNMLVWENRVTYAKARLAAALEGMQGPTFEDAMAQLA